ncbi:hypothetical protein [Arthrobacter sp. NPDC090010]|uniref:hypothetical protein n=1 Tax=Arthrobacter sp. NPDC090010 TaxID=3363942 RepID=UPI00382D2C9D
MSRNRKKPRQSEKKQSAAVRQSGALYKKADFAVDAQALPFVKWYEESDGNTGAEALQTLQSVKQFLWLHGAGGAPVLATEFDAAAFLRTMSQLEELGGEEESRIFRVMMDDLQLYIAFLDATGTWTGSEDDLQVILENFELSEMVPTEDVAAGEGSEESTVSTERAGWARELLLWIGEGKELTATGSLRLADIEGAASAVGIRAVGSQKRLSGEALAALADPEGNTPQVARSMAEVERLAVLWDALRASGLIEVAAKKAVPTAEGLRLSAPGQDAALLRALDGTEAPVTA